MSPDTKEPLIMTISEYCEQRKVNQRYLRRIVTAGKKQLLNDSYGIQSYKIFGKTYILTVRKGFEDLGKKLGASPPEMDNNPRIIETKNEAVIPITPKRKSRIADKGFAKGHKLKAVGVTLRDAKNMVAVGSATCTCDITDKKGKKKTTSFKSVNEAIKARKTSSSNSRIWILHEHFGLRFIVGRDGQPY